MSRKGVSLSAMEANMTPALEPLNCDPTQLPGLSERLIVSHYENNYGGVSRRLEAILAEWRALDPATAPIWRINGLKSEELIAANSKRLHEIYFDGLGKTEGPSGALAQAIEQSFGSLARWRAEFSAMGKALGGGSGWVLLMRRRRDGRLVNQWAADHAHAMVDVDPIMALDMYEHSYALDYGAKAAAYVDAYMANINWDAAARLFAGARAARPAEAIDIRDLQAELAGPKPPILIDVRRRARIEAAGDLLPGAVWRDPEKIDQWIGTLPKDRPVVAYCVFGHHVSHTARDRLAAAGFGARYLEGGIVTWRAAGLPLAPKTKENAS